MEIQHFSDLANARLALKALNVLSNPKALKTSALDLPPKPKTLNPKP